MSGYYDTSENKGVFMRYNTRMTKEQAKEIYADLGYLSQPFPYASAPFLESYARLLGL